MNIFVTNENPIQAARELCDQHTRSKLQIESAIMLQHCFSNEALEKAPRTKTGKVRKSGKGYYNHPCSVWVRETKENYMWLVEHTLEMFNERDYRWPESNPHFTKEFIEWCKNNVDETNNPNGNLTPFVVAVNPNSKCKLVKNFEKLSVTERYQLYVKHDKDFATWTKRQKPNWY